LDAVRVLSHDVPDRRAVLAVPPGVGIPCGVIGLGGFSSVLYIVVETDHGFEIFIISFRGFVGLDALKG
jgi:hypothetical protein